MTNAYLVQGLRNNTLVAGKTTGLRLFTEPGTAISVQAVDMVIIRPDGSRRVGGYGPDSIYPMAIDTPEESVVIPIRGLEFRDVGWYFLQACAYITGTVDSIAYLLGPVLFSETKDMRMMVSRIWSGTPEKPGEIQAAIDAMTRMATIYPLRDGISTLDGDYTAGLRYNLQNDPEGPPNQDGNIEPLWDTYKNPPPGKDTLDRALAYRFPNDGEGSGARTHATYNGWLPNSGVVWLAPLAHVFCHETGHNCGLEPSTSPHFDPTGQASHSKDQFIDADDAAGGVDLQFLQPFPTPTLDLMFPSGNSPGEPPAEVSLNSWDWEYVRKQLLKSNSTGPVSPSLVWQNLGGHDLRSTPSAVYNEDGRAEVFAVGGDRKLYHIWETAPQKGWHAWASLEGHDLEGFVTAVNNSDKSIQVFALGGDGIVYSRVQMNPNGNWNPWFSLGRLVCKGFSVSQNLDGRLEAVAVGKDGALYDSWQVNPGGEWSDWVTLNGHDLQGKVALAQNSDGRLEAFALGGDGYVYHRWQLAPNGSTGWGVWANLVDPRLSKVVDLRTALAPNGCLSVALMTADRSLSYISQTTPNGQWGVLIELDGHDLQWPCAFASTGDNRLELAVVGGDGHVYNRWQVDPNRPGLWAAWTELGSLKCHPGITLTAPRNGLWDLEAFVIGHDGALYHGTRLTTPNYGT